MKRQLSWWMFQCTCKGRVWSPTVIFKLATCHTGRMNIYNVRLRYNLQWGIVIPAAPVLKCFGPAHQRIHCTEINPALLWYRAVIDLRCANIYANSSTNSTWKNRHLSYLFLVSLWPFLMFCFVLFGLRFLQNADYVRHF